VVTSPAGVVEAPGDVAPSDSWVLRDRGVATVISIETGRIARTRITGGQSEMISLQGTVVAARHFTARGEERQGLRREIWLNDRDVPVKFRIVDGGTTVDFILASPLQDAAAAEAHLVPAASLRPDG